MKTETEADSEDFRSLEQVSYLRHSRSVETEAGSDRGFQVSSTGSTSVSGISGISGVPLSGVAFLGEFHSTGNSTGHSGFSRYLRCCRHPAFVFSTCVFQPLHRLLKFLSVQRRKRLASLVFDCFMFVACPFSPLG